MERGTAAARVAMCTFIGALAGGWAALALTSGILPAWLGVTVGMALGATVGAVLYAWHEIKQAIPEAFRHATAWRPDFAVAKRRTLLVVGYVNVALSGAVFILLVVSLAYYAGHGELPTAESFDGFAIFMLFVIGLISVGAFSDLSEVYGHGAYSYFEDWRWWFKYNPVTTCTFWPMVFIGRAVLFMCRLLPVAPGFTCRFAKELFLLVYSDGLHVAGFWAAAGAVLGYATGALVLSALAAAACGWVSYRLITVRRMVPARDADSA